MRGERGTPRRAVGPHRKLRVIDHRFRARNDCLGTTQFRLETLRSRTRGTRVRERRAPARAASLDAASRRASFGARARALGNTAPRACSVRAPSSPPTRRGRRRAQGMWRRRVGNALLGAETACQKTASEDTPSRTGANRASDPFAPGRVAPAVSARDATSRAASPRRKARWSVPYRDVLDAIQVRPANARARAVTRLRAYRERRRCGIVAGRRGRLRAVPRERPPRPRAPRTYARHAPCPWTRSLHGGRDDPRCAAGAAAPSREARPASRRAGPRERIFAAA